MSVAGTGKESRDPWHNWRISDCLASAPTRVRTVLPSGFSGRSSGTLVRDQNQGLADVIARHIKTFFLPHAEGDNAMSENYGTQNFFPRDEE